MKIIFERTHLVKIAILFFVLLLAFFIPSYKWIIPYIITGWMIFSLIDLNFKTRFKDNLDSSFKIFIFTIQMLFYLFYLISYFINNNSGIASNQLMQKLSFFLFPLLFALSGKDLSKNKDLILKLYVLSNIIMSILCLIIALYRSIFFVDGEMFFYPEFNSDISYFFSSRLSFFHHRGYFSLFLVFSILILFYFKDKNIIFNSNKGKNYYYLLIFFFSLMVFLMSSRASIFTLFIVLTWRISKFIYYSEKKIFKIIIPLVILGFFIIGLQNNRVNKTYRSFIDIIQNKEELSHENSPARLILWYSAIDLINENYLMGIGVDNFKNEFKTQYEKYNNEELKILMNSNYNVHNQFLETLLIFGLTGLLILLFLFVVPVTHAVRNKNPLFLGFLLLTGFNFLFESMLNTIAGIVFFSYFLNYFLFVGSINLKEN